jgi:broad specificity phosphatase PhoE
MNRLLLALLFALLLAPFATAGEKQIFIVRHAEKADATSGADSKDPDLSAAGHAHAESLARMLRDAELTAVFATEFKRTRKTAEPAARAAHVEVTVVPAQETDALVSSLRAAKGNALIVAHSNTIPVIIKTLGIERDVSVDEMDYDNLFIVLSDPQPRLLRLHY